MQMNLKILKCHALSQKIICLSALHTSLSRTFVRLLYTYEVYLAQKPDILRCIGSSCDKRRVSMQRVRLLGQCVLYHIVQFTQITNKNKGN